VLLWVLLRAGVDRLRLKLFLIATILFIVSYRALKFPKYGVLALYVGSYWRADSFLLGALLAVVIVDGWRPRTPAARAGMRALGLAGIGVFVATRTQVYTNAFLYQRGGLIIVALGAGAVILSLVTTPIPLLARVLSLRPLVVFGKISYAFYIWHYAALVWIGGMDVPYKNPGVWLIGSRFVLVTAIAAASYYLVERRFLRVKRRLEIVPTD
jgi:peptidoglycan/LPS O-acetylase OafA/YrhL